MHCAIALSKRTESGYFRRGNSFVQTDGIRILPQGKYLCADCTEENREETLRLLTTKAKDEYGASPRFSVQIIVLSGILQWNYQAQVPVEKI